MKKRITLTIDPELWQQFRVACVTRQVSASSEVETLIAGLVQQWEQKAGKPKKETTTIRSAVKKGGEKQ